MPARPHSTALATILLIDDEPDILELLKYNLNKAGYATQLAFNGAEGLEKTRKIKPDLVILDIMMPGLDGVFVCKAIRAEEPIAHTPIIMLTAKMNEESEVLGLEAGADDYLTKPVSPRLLVSRVQAVLRRTRKSTDGPQILQFPDIEINREEYVVRLQGKPIKLPKKEFELLFLLASYPGTVFTRDDLLEEIWGSDVYVVVRTVDVHVRKIRRKIGEMRIETIKGVGYKFVTPIIE
ncbi:MAG: response regulator transcription factor [Bacteroidetes Order II. Incertae sedis bacterium]|nr:response regulator transcription factor [Bacteroidetes Order II. bacterium]